MWSDYYGSNDTGTKTFDSMAQSYESRRRRNGWDNVSNGYAEETGQFDDVDEPSSESDPIGDTWQGNGDFKRRWFINEINIHHFYILKRKNQAFAWFFLPFLNSIIFPQHFDP